MNETADKARRGYSLRALGLKAVSYQRRQVFTNVCCISVCPILMVAISAGLGSLISTLIARSYKVETIQFCSNNFSLASDGFPIFNLSSPDIFGADTSSKSVNFIQNANLQGVSRNPGAQLYSFNKPCVFWFGSDYPQNSLIYERNAKSAPIFKIDSTYIPPPDIGWFGLIQAYIRDGPILAATSNKTSHIQLFSQFQQGTWIYTGARSAQLASLLGVIPPSPVSAANVASYLNAVSGTDLSGLYNPTYNPASGLLSAVPQRIYVNFSMLAGFSGLLPVPFSVPFINATTPEVLDDLLNARIQELIISLARLNKTVLQVTKPATADLLDFYIRAGNVGSIMPYGAVFLDAWDPETLAIRVLLQFGTDKRLLAAGNFPPAGQRMVTQMVQLNQAVLKALGARWGGKMKDARITQGIRAFPDSQTTGFNVEFGGIIGRILYPFGVSFLLPVFVIVLVKEKEDRIFAMMRMNGMKPWAYYLSHYVAFYLLFAVSSALFLISGRIARLSLFTKTEISILLLLFFIWGHVQIVLAFFFSALFSRSRIALVLTFLIVLCGVIISLVMDSLFPLSDPVPTAFFLWPPFAFYRILSDLNRASFSWTVPPYSFKRIEPGTEVANAFLLLTFEIFIYGIVALYLAAVVPSEFGTPRPWNFPVLAAVKYYKYRVQKKQTQPSEVLLARQISPSPGSLHEDDDVRRERQRVDDASFPADCPIVIYHMQKVYPPRGGLGPKFAVKDVTLAVERGLVLGMLGPNGAGKTTLISILTGLYEPSGGTARLAGLDVRTQLDDVYKIIGICPQFDILWDDLTVGEHLYFYARLKGIEPADEEAAVSRSLAKVSLSSLQHRLSKSLSGGEKRRLSIAIALVGDPTVVFLDEPTTGLDPEVRRLIWNIIREAKEGKTIVLTTHSMEEAEAVCQRIGIMAKGSMRCLGNPLRLKELYGSGFKVFFNSSQEDTARACEWVESILPKGWTKVDAFSTSTSYEFPSSPGVISQLFEHIEREKSAHGILDWGVSQTTLEEVFLRIISDADADAD